MLFNKRTKKCRATAPRQKKGYKRSLNEEIVSALNEVEKSTHKRTTLRDLVLAKAQTPRNTSHEPWYALDLFERIAGRKRQDSSFDFVPLSKNVKLCSFFDWLDGELLVLVKETQTARYYHGNDQCHFYRNGKEVFKISPTKDQRVRFLTSWDPSSLGFFRDVGQDYICIGKYDLDKELFLDLSKLTGDKELLEYFKSSPLVLV